MAQAALTRKSSTISGVMVSAMSRLLVYIMSQRTPWMHSKIAFAFGFLTEVGFCKIL